MSSPAKYDFINIHDHGSDPLEGVFTVENLMIHENRFPEKLKGIAYSVGVHPWSLEENALDIQLDKVRELSQQDNVIAIGESGFDKLRGAGAELQRKAFYAHVEISENAEMPLLIHCVRAWDELLKSYKELNPKMQWIIHGFRGKKELASQLTDKGFCLSPWVEWAIRPDSADTIKTISLNNLFLETDGFDIGIESVYRVVAEHLKISVVKLKETIYQNYISVFGT